MQDEAAGLIAAGDAAADAFLAAALRGEPAWQEGLPAERVVARAFYHGIAGRLAGQLDGWPEAASAPVRKAALSHAMWEIRHRQVLGGLLAAFEAAGVRVLLTKGTALAYDLYDPPASRMRGDTDILVDPSGIPAAREVLAGQGFRSPSAVPEAVEVLSLEEAWVLTTPDSLDHHVDLHHHAFSAPILADLLPFEEGWARARPLPRLAEAARGLPLDMALILACTHRAKHKVSPYYVEGARHVDGDRLIWLVDIDLLARRFGPEEWDLTLGRALRHGVGAVCHEALDMAARRLGTPVPPEVLRTLAAAPARTAATRYLLAQGLAGRLWSDLLATRGLQRRLDFLRLGLFPSATHMRAKYSDRPGAPLPVLYLRRIAGFVSSRVLGRRG